MFVIIWSAIGVVSDNNLLSEYIKVLYLLTKVGM